MVAYFCPRTAFILCEECFQVKLSDLLPLPRWRKTTSYPESFQAPDLGQVTAPDLSYPAVNSAKRRMQASAFPALPALPQAETCQQDIEMLKDPESCAVATPAICEALPARGFGHCDVQLRLLQSAYLAFAAALTRQWTAATLDHFACPLLAPASGEDTLPGCWALQGAQS